MYDIYLWGSEVEAADRDETHPMCVHLKSTGADAERYGDLPPLRIRLTDERGEVCETSAE